MRTGLERSQPSFVDHGRIVVRTASPAAGSRRRGHPGGKPRLVLGAHRQARGASSSAGGLRRAVRFEAGRRHRAANAARGGAGRADHRRRPARLGAGGGRTPSRRASRPRRSSIDGCALHGMRKTALSPPQTRPTAFLFVLQECLSVGNPGVLASLRTRRSRQMSGAAPGTLVASSAPEFQEFVFPSDAMRDAISASRDSPRPPGALPAWRA
jgi:hypothetical protein